MSQNKIELEYAENDNGDGISFCRGHVDKHVFVDVINENEDTDHGGGVTVESVAHQYWVAVPSVDKDGNESIAWKMVPEGTDGALPVTTVPVTVPISEAP